MNRSETLAGQNVVLGFRHFYSGILADALSITQVAIYGPTGNLVVTIPGNQVTRQDIGTYSVEVPGTNLMTPGQYSDVWSFIPVQGASTRTLAFQINVVTILTQDGGELSVALKVSLQDMDACMLKRYYLWPVWSILSNGYYLPDQVLQFHIDSAITRAQRELGIPLQRVRVLTKPYDVGVGEQPILGVDYDEDGDLLQWSAIDSEKWSSIRLPRSGILKVSSVRGIYQGKTVYRIPSDWIDRNFIRQGLVKIRPTTTGVINTLVDNSGQFLDVTLLESIGNTTVPGFWAVDYEYGQADGKFAKEICDVIMKRAAILILDQLGQQIGRGLAARSAGIDGLSTSMSTVASSERTLFGALVKRYETDLEQVNLDEMRKHYRGPVMFIL